MLAVLSLVFAALPLFLSEPICQKPPPPASYIPSLDDCQYLVEWIFAISELQDDEPFLWSRNPSPFGRSRKLPYYFMDPLPSRDCQFFVDVLHEGNEDTFPTKVVAEKAGEIVEECLERGIDGAETVGAVAVGPRRVIAVVLMRKGARKDGVGRGTFELNMANVTMLGAGNFSGMSPSLIEDG